MVKIGIDKTDPLGRKFYFDDSMVLTSNPPKYKVSYVDDESDIDYILCKDVFVLKPAPANKQPQPKEHTHTVNVKENINNVQVIDKNTLSKSTIRVPENTSITTEENNNVVEKQKKKPGRKKKEPTVENEVNVDTSNEIRNFEYIVIDEHFNDSDELQDMLNKYGQDGWELCGFEIYKSGLINPNSILCVLKRLLKR